MYKVAVAFPKALSRRAIAVIAIWQDIAENKPVSLLIYSPLQGRKFLLTSSCSGPFGRRAAQSVAAASRVSTPDAGYALHWDLIKWEAGFTPGA